ncbi:HNH endonuclease [Nocardioides sp.]|uniref:HNH endonuclease n=1 Tax=Nocardioides sp. TaxID=35761 RepID=UPI0039E68DE2
MSATAEPARSGAALDLVQTASDAVLADVASFREAAARAEVYAITRAAEFCLLHATTDPGAAALVAERGQVTDLALAGEGAPLVAEDAVAEFAAALGMADHTARDYLGDALEISQRLGPLWRRLQNGQVPVWRARLIARRTRTLTEAAAGYVAEHVAPLAHQIGATRLDRLVDAAIALHDPEEAARRAAEAAEQRHVSIAKHTPVDGTVYLDAALDLADAADLDAAIAQVAADLEPESDSLDVRRAKALGVIARRTLAGYDGTAPTRQLRLYVHLDRDLAGTGLARLESPDTLITLDQLKTWCATPGTSLRVTPVLDLAQPLTRDGYAPSEQMHEQATLVDATCVHPYCTRDARPADRDHNEPYDPNGPPDQTNTENLGSLCRLHHRLKTHAGWRYSKLSPGLYHWQSPGGRHYLRTPAGTYPLGRLSTDSRKGVSDPGPPG